MSPQEHPSVPQSPQALADWLDSEFAVTSNGFIPADVPLARLPDAYYTPWETLADTLPQLLQSGSFRTHVDTQLPVLSVDRLSAEREWRRAYLILTFATHAYIWGGSKPSEHLPPQITVPLLRISDRLDLPPAATYAATNLWNFRTSSQTADFSDLEALDSLISFTGTRDESWFFSISVAMECEGGPIIPIMIEAMNSIPAGTPESCTKLVAAMEHLMVCIRRVGEALERMHDHCEPDVFYHAIRPFLAGSKNMADAGLPRGVLYDEGDGKGEWMSLRGGSNGQSSLIQFFDIVLGVEHKATETQNSGAGGRMVTPKKQADGEEEELPFHEEVRGYMPGPHRRFLEFVRSLPSIRDFALQADAMSEERVLVRETFQRATRTLAELRNKHLKIVARYIILPSRKQQQQMRSGVPDDESQRRIGLAGVAWREPPQNPVALPKGSGEDKTRARRMSETQLTGTGGTALMPFLKQVRDETFRAGRADNVAVDAV